MLVQLKRKAGRLKRNFGRSRFEGYGHDFIGDVKKRLAHVDVRTIFDVGAHIGMTALQYSDEFPRAKVYAFEPHPGNFARMRSNLIGKPDVQLFRHGLGDRIGELPFHFDAVHPSMARIASHGENVTDTVRIETIDCFCEANSIHQIDLMKVDVEGHELPVLNGASGMLANSAISIIRIETAIDPDDCYHTQLWDLSELFHSQGYRLFGFYDQNEFPPKPENAKLRRFDAVFISSRVQHR